jgi:hypothetical protein
MQGPQGPKGARVRHAVLASLESAGIQQNKADDFFVFDACMTMIDSQSLGHISVVPVLSYALPASSQGVRRMAPL